MYKVDNHKKYYISFGKLYKPFKKIAENIIKLWWIYSFGLGA